MYYISSKSSNLLTTHRGLTNAAKMLPKPIFLTIFQYKYEMAYTLAFCFYQCQLVGLIVTDNVQAVAVAEHLVQWTAYFVLCYIALRSKLIWRSSSKNKVLLNATHNMPSTVHGQSSAHEWQIVNYSSFRMLERPLKLAKTRLRLMLRPKPHLQNS